MSEYKLFKMKAGGGYEFYIVIDNEYFYLDTDNNSWWEGYYSSWEMKMKQDQVSETSELEMLVLAGEKVVGAVEQFETKGPVFAKGKRPAWDSMTKSRLD